MYLVLPLTNAPTEFSILDAVWHRELAKIENPVQPFECSAGAGSSLVKLDLSDNPMTTEVAQALAEALRGQERLQVLNLNDVALGDEGVESIAEVRSNLCPRHTA